MILEDILKEFRGEEGVGAQNPEWQSIFSELCQEAIRIGMELNNHYHTPEEIREMMGRLTGKKLENDFIQTLVRTLQLGKMSLLIPAVIFRIRAASRSAMARW